MSYICWVNFGRALNAQSCKCCPSSWAVFVSVRSEVMWVFRPIKSVMLWSRFWYLFFFFKLTVWCVVCLQFVIKLKGWDNISLTCLVSIISAYCSSISVVVYGGESIVKVTKLISKKQQLNGLILSPQWNKLCWMVFTNVLLGCLCSLVRYIKGLNNLRWHWMFWPKIRRITRT